MEIGTIKTTLALIASPHCCKTLLMCSAVETAACLLFSCVTLSESTQVMIQSNKQILAEIVCVLSKLDVFIVGCFSSWCAFFALLTLLLLLPFSALKYLVVKCKCKQKVNVCSLQVKIGYIGFATVVEFFFFFITNKTTIFWC